MRRVALLLACVILASGCFVFDELDKGQKTMDKYSHMNKGRAKEEPAPAPEPSPKQKDEGEGLIAQVQDWLARRSAKAEAERPSVDPHDVPVRCQIHGHTQFLRKFDCMLRGGKEL